MLWVIANALGGIGGRHQERSRKLAEQLAAAGDTSDRRAARAAPRPEGERDVLARRARDARDPRPDDLEAGLVVVLAYSRPFWPLFLHVLGAMTLFGAILAAVILSAAAWRAPDRAYLRKATFWALVSRDPRLRRPAGAARSGSTPTEGFSGNDDPTWIGIGFAVADAGLLLLLASIGCAYWWLRGGKPLAGRIVAGLSSALSRPARRRLARDVREMGLTKRLRQEGETPRKRGIGSAQ